MTFDKKEQKILEHYKTLLESSLFDEYDILAFLIFMRRHMGRDRYPYLRDFADLIAHRGRDRGIAMDAISGAIENGYSLVQGQKKIEGYHGIDREKWKQEWIDLASRFDFTINENIIAEATMCIFSLAQFTTYNNEQHHANMELFQSSDHCLALATTEGNPDSIYICFSKYGPFQFAKEYPGGHITDPVEAVRVDGILRLKDKNGYII